MSGRSHVRRAEFDDAGWLAECHVAGWREAYAGIVAAETLALRTGDLLARTQRWRDVLSTGPRRTWLAVADDRVLGFASCGPARDDDMAELPELYALYVRASEYGSGLADRLVQPLIEASPAYLWVAADNPRAIRYYHKIGFRPDGHTKVNDWFGGIREVRMSRSDGSPVQK